MTERNDREAYDVDAAAFAAQRTALNVRAQLEAQAAAALISNRAFLEIATPAQQQLLAQVRALTRQHNAIIRLQSNDFTGTD